MATWKRIDSVNYSLKKENQYLLSKVILYTPNQINSYCKYVKKLYLSTLLRYTSKPGSEKFSGAEYFENNLQNVMNQNS